MKCLLAFHVDWQKWVLEKKFVSCNNVQKLKEHLNVWTHQGINYFEPNLDFIHCFFSSLAKNFKKMFLRALLKTQAHKHFIIFFPPSRACFCFPSFVVFFPFPSNIVPPWPPHNKWVGSLTNYPICLTNTITNSWVFSFKKEIKCTIINFLRLFVKEKIQCT